MVSLQVALLEMHPLERKAAQQELSPADCSLAADEISVASGKGGGSWHWVGGVIDHHFYEA